MTQLKPIVCRMERKENTVVTRESRCLNSSHGRSEPPVRYCPSCGELVTEEATFFGVETENESTVFDTCDVDSIRLAKELHSDRQGPVDS